MLLRPCRCLKRLLLPTWRECLLRPLIIYNSFLFLMKNVLRHDDHNKGLALIYIGLWLQPYSIYTRMKVKTSFAHARYDSIYESATTTTDDECRDSR